ncbi:hypothetical protein HKD37_02G004413 [Glycine soja]
MSDSFEVDTGVSCLVGIGVKSTTHRERGFLSAVIVSSQFVKRREHASEVLRDGRKERLGSRPIGRHPLPSLGQTESDAAKQPKFKACCLMRNALRLDSMKKPFDNMRDAAAEGTSAAPEFDSHLFRSAEHQQHFEAIKGWSFHRERRVQLRDDEYTNFQEEIACRRWTSLVTPMAKFDPDIVLEFYANSWPTEEGVRDMRSWVRGQWIPFDADALSQFLGDPLVLEEGQECEFGQRRNRADGFDEEVVAQLLCIPGQDFARTAAGRRVRIMRTSMTTLTQMWMTLLLSNVLPSDHNYDLPLPKCQLVYAILTRMSVHVAQLIADAIYLFAGMPPTRHPLDPDKSNKALGFPALITGLCQSFGVPVTPNQFKAEVAWPGDWPEAQAGEAPAEAPSDAEEARMDKEMTDLLGFLGGSGAT